MQGGQDHYPFMILQDSYTSLVVVLNMEADSNIINVSPSERIFYLRPFLKRTGAF